MKKLLVLISFSVFFINNFYYCQSSSNPAITAKEIQAIINYLASDKLEGRFTGSKGAGLAAEFIKKDFLSSGLLPLFNGSYYQDFPFIAGIEPAAGNSFQLFTNKKADNLKLNKDYIPAPFSGNFRIESQLVFAGYGISAQELNYDDYAGLDVRGKAVVILRFNPDEGHARSKFEKYSALRYKAKVAKEKGAAAVIFVNGYYPKDDEDKLMKLSYDGAKGIDSLCIVQVKRNIIDRLFNSENLNLKNYQARMDSTKKPASFIFKNSNIKIETGLREITKYGRNVAGYIRGSDPSLSNQYIVLGAHYDHLGYGEIGSLYRGKEKKIHYGADDNASGTAGIMELAEKFSSIKTKLKRSLIFICFAGEELGTLGSSYFVNNPPVPLQNISAMINLDMIGRLNTDNDLIVYGLGTSSIWKDLIEKDKAGFNFNMKLKDDGYAPSDQSSFYAKNIPVLFFFTDIHSDYHRPTDIASKINSAGEEKILKLVDQISFQVDTLSIKPDYISVPRKDTGEKISFRVYVGTIPDFGSQADGYKINGVSEGSPAQKGGLKAGDVIINFGGKKISNIYDFTYALGDFSPGDIVDVSVLRNGEKINLKLELGVR